MEGTPPSRASTASPPPLRSRARRWRIVLATAKRARQLIAGEEALVMAPPEKKSLSVAVEELYEGKVKIVGEDDSDNEEEETDTRE